jgi:uncharacterized phage-associated protein
VAGEWPSVSEGNSPVLSVYDVASAILKRQGPIDALKLQKLVYYAQAWYLAWYGEPLFSGEFEAWRMGPVSPDLYSMHKGRDVVSHVLGGNSNKLDEQQNLALEVVLDRYGKYPTYRLADMTHREGPWRIARGDLPTSAAGNTVISKDSMAKYYREVGGVDLPVVTEEPPAEVVARVWNGSSDAIGEYLAQVSGGAVTVTDLD